MNLDSLIYTSQKLELKVILELLNKYGVVIIPEYLNKSDNEALLKEFDLFFDKPDDDSKKETPYSLGRSIRAVKSKLNSEYYSKTIKVFSSSFMNELKNQYLSEKSDLNEAIFIAKDVVGAKHVANDMHFDIIPTLKFFIYLTDTTELNGAFTCVPGTHEQTKIIRKNHSNKISFENRDFSRQLKYSDSDVTPIEGKAGTLIIFTSDTFHKAGTVTKGERKIMRGHSRLPKFDPNKSMKNKLKKIFKF